MKKNSVGSNSEVSDRLRRVEGRHNALVKDLRKAFSHGDLTADGHCAVEGMRILEEAIRSGLRFRAVFFSSSALARAERLLPQLAAYVETLLLPDKLFATAVPSESPQGVAALVRCPAFTVNDVLAKSASGPVLAISGVQDPGNLGTILRSAEAFGAAGVLLGEGTVSPFNSKVVRASAGSVFRLPIARVKLGEVLPQMRSGGWRLVATSSHKGTPVHEARLTGPLAIFIGSEGAGLPRDLLAQMDETLAIPHSPQVESLNAGVAASIVLYEAARQRQ
ncbi:MAG: TrmH family RNA methyltransferase [Terriglobales bacterium]